MSEPIINIGSSYEFDESGSRLKINHDTDGNVLNYDPDTLNGRWKLDSLQVGSPSQNPNDTQLGIGGGGKLFFANGGSHVQRTSTGIPNGPSTQVQGPEGVTLSSNLSNTEILNAIGSGSRVQLPNGHIQHNRVTKSSNFTTSGEGRYTIDTSSSSITATLATTDARDGAEFTFKRDGSNKATVDTEGSATIDGKTSTEIIKDDGSVTLHYNSDNDDWEILGGGSPSSLDIHYTPGHTSWPSGLTNEEIHRFACKSGETFKLGRVELRQKGGGSSTNTSIDVYDDSDSTSLDSSQLGNSSTSGGESTSGATILVRLTQSEGSSITASPIVIGTIG